MKTNKITGNNRLDKLFVVTLITHKRIGKYQKV